MFTAEFSWNDVGAWSSVYDLNPKDGNNNATANGNNILIETRNSLVFSTEEKPISVIGLENVAVINTENGILVEDINELQQVKKVIEQLKK